MASAHQQLAELISSANSVVALTGAGISVPSGIPDFRTPGTGLWENVDPMKVVHIDVFRNDPETFWTYYADRFATLDSKEPNAAHTALANLEAEGLLDAVITQNIDLLHHKAGSENVIELHGSIASSSCLACGESQLLADVRKQLAEKSVPLCSCGQPLKPDVVLFGEMLPEAALMRATRLAQSADLMLCIGSSLEVYPAAGLPDLTLANGGKLAVITAGDTQYDAHAAIKLSGKIDDELAALADYL